MPAAAPSPSALRDAGARVRFALVVALMLVLWVAGGASRADVGGQFVVRGAAWLLLITGLLWLPAPRRWPIAPAAILVAAAALPALQLIPLPPGLWTGLPGRALFAGAMEVSGQDQPWRPLSIAPAATVNALSALVVPATLLFLAAGLGRRDDQRLGAVLVGLVAASCVVALLQASGARFDYPMINDGPGSVGGNFANRNHFALFAALGCVLAPAWALNEPRPARTKQDWRALAALGLVLLFILVILAAGSRAGLVLGAVGLVLGAVNVRRPLAERLRHTPQRLRLALVGAAIGVMAAAVVASVFLGRATAVERALAGDAASDMRRQALPTVLQLIERYFPAGSGFGTFDPVYRIAEPADLLQTAYLNHAHNDWLEILLDGGLLAGLVMAAALVWYILASWRAWRGFPESALRARTGSAMLLLVMLASTVDYPARTPLIMAVTMLAAIWLARGSGAGEAGGVRSAAATPPGARNPYS